LDTRRSFEVVDVQVLDEFVESFQSEANSAAFILARMLDWISGAQKLGALPSIDRIRNISLAAPQWAGGAAYSLGGSMQLGRVSRLSMVGAIALVIVAAIVGCTLVGDRLTGISLDKAGPSGCIRSCSGSFADQVHAEAEVHQNAIKGCQQLSSAERGPCIQAEAARHQAAMQQISSGRQECMNGCHRQGGGSAG